MDYEILTRRPTKSKHLEKLSLSLEKLSECFKAALTDKKSLAIISLILFIGLRPEQICRIKVEDIDLDEHYLTINWRTRIYQLPIPQYCYDIIASYSVLYGRKNGLLFFTKAGLPISVRHISRVINRISKAAHVRRVTSSDLRRDYLSLALGGSDSLAGPKVSLGQGSHNGNSLQPYFHLRG